jgi:tail protein
MLTRVEVQTTRGTSLILPLVDPENGFVIAEIEGLDPVKAVLVSSNFAGVDGEKYHPSGTRREKRNIKLKLDYNPDFQSTTIDSLRTTLYSVLMPKTEVNLRFYDDTGIYVDIWCVVESFDDPKFVKDPDATISLIGYDPDFVNPVQVSFTGSTVPDATTSDINYLGTVDTGIDLTLAIDRAVSAFTVYNTPPGSITKQMIFAADTPFSAGDSLRFSTVSGAKGVWRTRAGVVTSLLYGLSMQSAWLSMEGPGINRFRVFATGAAIPYTLKYFTRYGGL